MTVTPAGVNRARSLDEISDGDRSLGEYMKSRKKSGPYDAMGALDALRKVAIREVEESIPSLTSEQLLEWAFVAFDARVRPGNTVAAQNYVVEHGVSFEEAERLVEKGC